MLDLSSDYLRGVLYGISAVIIWAGGIVAVRFAVVTDLTPWDIAAIRFGTAGFIMIPVLMSKGLGLDRLGWWGLAGIVIGGGAPMMLITNAGLIFAPAAHAGALFTGVVPLLVAIMATLWLQETFPLTKTLGLLFILAGVIGIVWGAGGTIGSGENFGHVLFLTSGLLLAWFTIAMRKARLVGLHAAAIAAVTGLLVYGPAYVAMHGASLLEASTRSIAIQAIVQILAAVVSIVLYARAVHFLGASGGAAFSSLCPVLTALMAIPILGEWPPLTEWLAILSITAGVYLVSGGLLPKTLIVSATGR
jgi:drug/metabolite transporter (DMT)-like permease